MDENTGIPQPSFEPDDQPTQQQPTRPQPVRPAAHEGSTYGSASDADKTAARHAAYVPPIPGQEPGLVPAAPEPEKPKHSNKGLKAVAAGLIGGVVGAGLLVGVLLGTGVIGKSGAASTGTTQQVTINPSSDSTTTANAVAAKALPSVVTINVTSSSSSGLGSGVILDTDGNIITNNHVVEDADSITATINGTTYDATLVGTDSSSDLAVIHVDLNGASVTPIEVGDSSAVQVGDWVMTVGSPFGLDQSVSQGIVSALTRNSMQTGTSGNTLYTNLIQVDAAINPGNSGGALVDDEGKLIGICTLYSSDTQSFAGIGFAIPGNYAVSVANKIIAGETVTHAHIGVSMQTVNSQNAKANKLSVSQGAYVAEVTENGPAANAGIKQGDIITKIADTTITSADDVLLAVRSHEIGDTVQVTVMRGSDEKTFSVTLDSDEELQKQQSTQTTSDINSYQNQINNNLDNTTGNDWTQLFEQWIQQRQNTNGYGGNGSGRGYGYTN